MTRARAAKRPAAVSSPHDAAERQADRAADAVTRGGHVTGWSFGSVAPTAAVHRQESGGASTQEQLQQAAGKAGEAALETEAGKKLIEAVKADPLVKKATDFVGTTTGKVFAAGVVAGGVGALAATKQPLPFQAPEFSLDGVIPGLSGRVTVEGPLNAPSFVGVSLTFREQGPKGAKGPTRSEAIAADTARLRAANEMFKPQSVKAREAADEQAAIAAFLDAEARRWRRATLIPLTPGAAPKTVPAPAPAPEQQREEPTPVQRAPATTTDSDTGLDTSGVPAAVTDAGRALDPATRRSMEARFGYDFGDVRIHDSGTAAAATADLQAAAFTVGEDIVFGGGRYDPDTPHGRHLLAHELAHVVQQRHAGPDGRQVHRRSVFETVGIWLGLVEGTFGDTELRAYLDQITKTGTISKAYDADNKARAIVGLWKAATAGWDLLGPQKALLIDEMLDGPTLNDDERAILDLLEQSDAGDLREIFADPVARMQRLDRDLDGAEHDRLSAFVAGRFAGGRSGLLGGKVEVLGDPVPATAPRHGFTTATFDARLDSERTAPELIAIIDTYSPADRGTALEHLTREVWPKAKKERAAAASADRDGLTTEEEYELDLREWTAGQRIAKSERILQHYFLSAIPPTKEALAAGTAPVDPALADQLRNVLLPKQYTAEAKAEADKTGADKTGADKTAEPAKDASTPAPQPVPERAKFHDPDKYRADIEAAIPGVIKENYDTTVTAKGPRAANAEIEAMAEPAKDETDAVFGQFYDKAKHPALKYPSKSKPGNLHSWYDTADRELRAMSAKQRRAQAVDWLKYYFIAEDAIRDINDTYSASPEWQPKRNAEARILDAVARKVCADGTTVQTLLETRRAWGGMAAGSQVFVDLYHNPDATKDRQDRWEMFQTLIHEYIHTLSHRDYEKYAKSFGVDTGQWNTLIEGVDNVLEEVVWARVEPRTSDPTLRGQVEGKAHAKLPPMQVSAPARYPSYEEAFRLTGLVGITNVVAAYFLGLVDRISVPKGRKQ